MNFKNEKVIKFQILYFILCHINSLEINKIINKLLQNKIHRTHFEYTQKFLRTHYSSWWNNNEVIMVEKKNKKLKVTVESKKDF